MFLTLLKPAQNGIEDGSEQNVNLDAECTTNTASAGTDLKLSNNFSLAELTKSTTANRLRMQNLMAAEHVTNLKALCDNVLQPIRDHFKLPVTITSGFRSKELNKRIGSSEKSQHIKGEAADLEIAGVDNLLTARWIRDNLEFDQLILEYYTPGDPTSGWVHVSYSRTGLNRKEVLWITKDGLLEIGLP